MPPKWLWWATALGAIGVMLVPDRAFAWTPATHIYLGESVLANLGQLAHDVAAIIRAFPYDFLYGNIAADTSFAKKYAPVGRHCHSWHVGQEILDRAETEALRAFGLGYLCHLAADTVAHNFYVPRQLLITSSTIALGHSYWESRFETRLGPHYAREAMDVVRAGHDAADAHLDDILSPTIFSQRTNRRLFRGMVNITETQSWQRIVRMAEQRSRWDIHTNEVEQYMGRAFQYIMEVLSESGDTTTKRLDPSGESSLRLAKKMRIDIVKKVTSPRMDELIAMADDHFDMPNESVEFWESSPLKRPWLTHE